MAQGSTASVDVTATGTIRIVERTRQFAQQLFDPYRPELHYMRGPGPKWREKQGQQPAKADSRQLELPGLWQARA